MGLRRLLGIRPSGRRRATQDVDAMIASGDLDRAEKQLRAGVHKNPNSLGHRVRLAELLARNRKPALAVAEYTAVARLHAGNESYGPAIRMVNKALELAPGSVDLTTQLVRWERLAKARGKRGPIVDHLNHAEVASGPVRRLTASQLLSLWPEIFSSTIVQEVPADQLGKFFAALEPIPVGDRMAVMRQGQIIARGHLIAAGAVEATVQGAAGRRESLMVFGPGEFFGESCLLDDRSCPATYSAYGEDASVLRMTRRSLDFLLRDPGTQALIDAIRKIGCDGRVRDLAQRSRRPHGGRGGAGDA